MSGHRFARWRLKVWTKRLNRRRAAWESVPPERTAEWLFWERQVTKALLCRVKWRRRTGVVLRSGGPVSKGQTFIRGESGPDLFIQYDGTKLSPPAGKPVPRLPDPGQPERGKRDGI